MCLLVINIDVQDLTLPQHSNSTFYNSDGTLYSYSGLGWELLNALHSTGARYKIKLSDNTATIKSSPRPNSWADSDSA